MRGKLSREEFQKKVEGFVLPERSDVGNKQFIAIQDYGLQIYEDCRGTAECLMTIESLDVNSATKILLTSVVTHRMMF